MSRALLDTHALLWWLTDDERLPEASRVVIGDETNEVFISSASAWEIAAKHRLGKLSGVASVVERFEELVTASGFAHLPITYLHSLRAGSYQTSHRDPFDRMLAAQSELERLTIVSRDRAFREFDVETVW